MGSPNFKNKEGAKMPWTNDQLYAMVNKPEPEEIARYDLVNKPDPEELMHFGILGMKWGKRRYQNEDGTYTEEGLRRKRMQEEKYQKDKEKWLKDPKEFEKHYDEFTEEERRKAIKRRQDIAAFKGKDGGKKEGFRDSLKKELKNTRELVNELVTYGTAMMLAYKWITSEKGQQTVNKGKEVLNKIGKWVIK